MSKFEITIKLDGTKAQNEKRSQKAKQYLDAWISGKTITYKKAQHHVYYVSCTVVEDGPDYWTIGLVKAGDG